MSDSRLRCFIAVALPAKIKQELAGVQARLKAGRIKAGWPDPSGFHLTLCFLGEVKTETLLNIKRAMTEAVAETPCLGLKLGGLGAFPKPDRARVLWIGLDEGAGELKKLHHRLGVRLKDFGLGRPQKFSPHITLARIRVPVSSGIHELMTRVPGPVLNRFTVEQIHLYSSRLARSGAVHTCLFSSRLSGC